MGLLVDPIPDSLNQHHKNCMVDSKENYQLDLGSERVKCLFQEDNHVSYHQVQIHYLFLNNLFISDSSLIFTS